GLYGLHGRSVAALCHLMVSESLSCGAKPSGARQSVDRPGARSAPDNRVSQAPRPPGWPTELLLSRGCISWAGRHPTPTLSIEYSRPNISTLRHALLDFRLSLPQEWARDEQRRQECHVPSEVRYQTRQEQCLEMLDEWGEQVPHGWVTGDDELGRHTRFRGELRDRGERYVLGVPCTTTMRDLEAPLPAYQGRGRRPKSPWHSVTQWRQGREAEAWTYLM